MKKYFITLLVCFALSACQTPESLWSNPENPFMLTGMDFTQKLDLPLCSEEITQTMLRMSLTEDELIELKQAIHTPCFIVSPTDKDSENYNSYNAFIAIPATRQLPPLLILVYNVHYFDARSPHYSIGIHTPSASKEIMLKMIKESYPEFKTQKELFYISRLKENINISIFESKIATDSFHGFMVVIDTTPSY